MAVREELLCARLILKKGWLSRSVLEKALAEFPAFREKMTFCDYLESGKLLSPERTDLVREALRRHQAGETLDSSAVEDVPARPVSAPHRPASAGRRSGARSSASGTAVKVVVALAVAGFAVLAFTVLKGGGPKDKGRQKQTAARSSSRSDRPPRPVKSPPVAKKEEPGAIAKPKPAGEPEDLGPAPPENRLVERIKALSNDPAGQWELVAAFLKRYPTSDKRAEVEGVRDALEAHARGELAGLIKQRPDSEKERRFKEYLFELREFAGKWEGTAAGEKAAEEGLRVEDAWQKACERAWVTVHGHSDAGRDAQALAALLDLRRWCPDDEQEAVDLEIKEIQRRSPDTTVASAPQVDPTEPLGGETLEEEDRAVDKELARLEEEDRKAQAKRRALNQVPWTAEQDIVLRIEAHARLKGTLKRDPPREALLAKGLMTAQPPYRLMGYGSNAHEPDYVVRVTLEPKYLGEKKFYGSVVMSRQWECRTKIQVLSRDGKRVLYQIDLGVVKESYPAGVKDKAEQLILQKAGETIVRDLRSKPGWRLP